MERFCHYNFFSISSSVALDTLQWVYLLQSSFVRFVGGVFFALHSGGFTPTEYTFTISCCINQNISVCHTYGYDGYPSDCEYSHATFIWFIYVNYIAIAVWNGCVFESVYLNSKCALIYTPWSLEFVRNPHLLYPLYTSKFNRIGFIGNLHWFCSTDFAPNSIKQWCRLASASAFAFEFVQLKSDFLIGSVSIEPFYTLSAFS